MAKKTVTKKRQLELNAKARERYAMDPKKGAAPSKKWQANNPDRVKASAKAWRDAHPGRLAELSKAWRKKNPVRVKVAHDAWVAANRKRVSEISMKWTNAHKDQAKASMAVWASKNKAKRKTDHKVWRENTLERMTGRKRPKVCDVCKRPGQRIHYDHDHKTGLFRGWLCHGCNIALGGVGDSAKVLRRLADYLDAYKATPKVRGEQAKAQKAYAVKKAVNHARTVAKKKGAKK